MSERGLELGTFCSRERYLNRSATAPLFEEDICYIAKVEYHIQKKRFKWLEKLDQYHDGDLFGSIFVGLRNNCEKPSSVQGLK